MWALRHAVPRCGDRTKQTKQTNFRTALQKPTTFFADEWRTPTYVLDLLAACRAAVERGDGLPPGRRVFNVGGPQRVNRVDMALAVAEARGYDPSLVLPGSSSDVPRTCATPLDISMDCTALQQELGVTLTPFKVALQQIFETGCSGGKAAAKAAA